MRISLKFLTISMKKLLLIIKVFKSQSVADLIFDDFVIFNEKVYRKFDVVPYTGVIKTSNGKNKFWMISNYKNGLPHGLHKRFFFDGSIMEKGFYDSGYRIGQWNGYYPDGSINYNLTKTYK